MVVEEEEDGREGLDTKSWTEDANKSSPELQKYAHVIARSLSSCPFRTTMSSSSVEI